MSKYRNNEYYRNPTAGQALDNIAREEQRRRRPRIHRALVKPREAPGYRPFEEVLRNDQ